MITLNAIYKRSLVDAPYLVIPIRISNRASGPMVIYNFYEKDGSDFETLLKDWDKSFHLLGDALPEELFTL